MSEGVVILVHPAWAKLFAEYLPRKDNVVPLPKRATPPTTNQKE